MKVPKKVKKYCPSCKKHAEVKVKQQKTKPKPKTKKRALKWGVRHYADVASGYGGSRRPVVHPVKQAKKLGLLYECETCKKKFYKQNTKRAKKVQLI